MPTKLNSITHNVHEQAVRVERVQGDIDSFVYDYFFKHVVCFTHGSRQALINFFFQRLYEECIELDIPRVWDEENGPKIVEILNRLNFKDITPQNAQPGQPKRRTSTRRTHLPPPVHKGKPTSKGHVDGAATGVSEADAHHGAIAPDPNINVAARIQDPQVQTIN